MKRRPHYDSDGSAAGFGALWRDERSQADLFFTDLMGRPEAAPALWRRPPGQALLRERPPAEHDTTGVPVLRPGIVGPAVDGTVNVAQIGFVSPSGAFEEPPNQLTTINGLTPRFTRAFAGVGHRVAFNRAPREPSPPFSDQAHFSFAGRDAQRWAALRWGLFDPATTAAIATRGGHGATRLLDELAAHVARVMSQQGHRWPLIPPVHEVLRPKRIVGFSDFTAVLLAAYNLLGWASLHGPMLCCPGGTTGLASLVRALTTAPANLYPRNLVDANLRLVGAAPANAVRGVLLGGNLALVDALYGSSFFPSLQGALLFVEETNEEGRRIDRMIEGLKHRGAAGQVRGVVVGHAGDITPIEVATLFRESWNVPCVFGLESGHGTPNRALWIGLEYELQFPGGNRASLFLRP